MDYKWQGEKVKVQFGYCKVERDAQRSLLWYNYECHIHEGKDPETEIRIPAILVNYGDEKFVIANHFGIAHYKLMQGGWPISPHFSLPLSGFIPKHDFAIQGFDAESYLIHEHNRKIWQRETYPLEYEQIKSLEILLTHYPVKKNDKSNILP